jgi:hypothetical protein
MDEVGAEEQQQEINRIIQPMDLVRCVHFSDFDGCCGLVTSVMPR